MAKNYEEAQVTLEEFEWGDELCEVHLEVDYSLTDYWPGNYDQPPEGGELEVELVRVTGALVGPDQLEASTETLKAMQKALNKDREALARIEDLVVMSIEA